MYEYINEKFNNIFYIAAPPPNNFFGKKIN
jgi:hypothetical protein